MKEKIGIEIKNPRAINLGGRKRVKNQIKEVMQLCKRMLMFIKYQK